MKKTIALVLSLVLAVCVCACTPKTEKVPEPEPKNPWESAIYTSNKALGEGEKSLHISIKAEDKEVFFTIKTNADMLADALDEVGLIEVKKGSKGTVIQSLNGMPAVDGTHKRYWVVRKSGQDVEGGIDNAPITNGVTYKFEYRK